MQIGRERVLARRDDMPQPKAVFLSTITTHPGFVNGSRGRDPSPGVAKKVVHGVLGVFTRSR
jgi:hypothetical protein